jgi:uncharacterized LabA/DUF88 family protein
LDRVAVFVDAGYLFAQGSALLSGQKKPRSELYLDEPKAVEHLLRFAIEKAGCSLLRIYWYDGSIASGNLTLEHAELAKLDHVKVRLGYINNFGQQKGVDSLIVTDIIELARQKAICDAVLMSGDEDVRIGVQIAQNYGVRVHLLGIQPSKASQSQQLLWEADTTSEWGVDVVELFLSVRSASKRQASEATGNVGETLDTLARNAAEELLDHELRALPTGQQSNWQLPADLDGKLLVLAARTLGRDLDPAQKRDIWSSFRKWARARQGG